MARFLEAWIRLAMADVRLRVLPYRYNRRLLEPGVPLEVSSSTAVTDSSAFEKRLASMLRDVNRAAHRQLFFNMSCLRKAIVIREKLRNMGVRTVLVYGAKQNQEAGPACVSTHAWLEVVAPEQVKGMVIDPSSLSHQFSRLKGRARQVHRK